MASETGSLVQTCVGEALRFTRENVRFILAVALLGAGGIAAVSVLAGISPALGFIALMGPGLLQAFAYAALTGASLYGTSAVRHRIVGDGARVWLAMAVVGFFLFIVTIIAGIPAMIALISGPLAPFVPRLQEAGQDEQRVLAVLMEFAEANPGALLGVMAFFFVIWMLLTSRLYLAAPASIDQGRVQTFETWSWTKGAMLRIVGARLMLLVPANILAGAMGYLAGRAVGVNTMDLASMTGAAASNPAGVLIAAFAANFCSLALYSALEAGLSAAFYRALKPAPR